MPIGIRPIVDFAFMKTFGSPENRICLLSLLNAILQLPVPIEDATLENPFNMKDFEEDKLSILDIKARDGQGAIFHIEMQLTPSSGLVKRLVFYGCELFADQLRAGDNYLNLCPVYSICLLEGVLWPDTTRCHNRFRLIDSVTGRILGETLEFHILELGMYNLTESELAGATTLEKWIFWLLHAQRYESDDLIRLMPEEAFRQATRAITVIQNRTEEKTMYDSREKALRDFQWHIDAAMLKGKVEGKAEGILIGKIKTLQSVLNQAVSEDDELQKMTFSQLESLAAKLQIEFHNRLPDKQD